jgi:ABC-type sulfate transport system permease component
MISWQLIGVALVFSMALAYVSRRAWARLLSTTKQNRAASSCASTCGGCGTAALTKVHSINR